MGYSRYDMKGNKMTFTLPNGTRADIKPSTGQTIIMRRDHSQMVFGRKGQYTIYWICGSWRFNISNSYPVFEYPPNTPTKMLKITKVAGKDNIEVEIF